MSKRKSGKIRIGVVFGGRSAEHEVSLVSAASVMKYLDRKKYEVVPVGISKQGQWLAGPRALGLLSSGTKALPPSLRKALLPEPGKRGGELVPMEPKAAAQNLDVIFPVLHGTYGEDGTVQGLLELANVPYVGCGVLGSALGMDKIAQKLIYQAKGIPTPEFEYFTQADWATQRKSILRRIKHLGYPVFVKPANLGSSVGISKVKQGRQLKGAVKLALKYDTRIIVERSITDAMEIEVAVLGNDKPKASVAGQILSSNEFYDYDAKYVDGKSKAVIPAPLPKRVSDQVRVMAVAAFKDLDLKGMARVDFLVSRRTFRAYVNEVNTIPGFTSISMYPKLWEATGLPYPKLLDELVRLAVERHNSRQTLGTSYRPKSAWYRS